MTRPPPRTTRTDTLLPDTTLLRSRSTAHAHALLLAGSRQHGGALAADRARYPAPAVAGRLRIARAEVPGLTRTQSAQRGADAGDRRSAARRTGGAAGATVRHASGDAARQEKGTRGDEGVR